MIILLRRLFNGHGSKVLLLRFSLILVLLYSAYVLFFKFAEGVSYNEANWQAWQTFTTVGYGNAPAQTLQGRVINIIFGTVGIAVLGTVITLFFDYRTELREKRRYGLMKNPQTNGYVFIHFPGVPVFLNLLSEIRFKERDVPICIVDSRLESLPEAISSLEKIHFVRGELTQRETYENAGLKECKVVVVFPLDPLQPDSDAGTSKIVELVSRYVTSETRIMHVLVSLSNSWLFEKINSTPIYQSMETLAVVQEAQDPGSAKIIQQILSNVEGANPHTFIPDSIVGWTWGQFLLALMERKFRVTPWAIISGNDIDTCPDLDRVIRHGDIISLLAHNGFDLSNLEHSLCQVRKMKGGDNSVVVAKGRV